MFPLLYPNELTPLKLILWFTFLIAAVILFKQHFGCINLRFYERFYIGFLPLLTIYETVLHKVIFSDKLPFLPLALTSMYCALGVTYSYIIYYYEYMTEDDRSIQGPTRKDSEEMSTMYDLKES